MNWEGVCLPGAAYTRSDGERFVCRGPRGDKVEVRFQGRVERLTMDRMRTLLADSVLLVEQPNGDEDGDRPLR